MADKPTTNLVVIKHTTTSLLEGISDPLDNPPLDDCVEQTLRLLTSISGSSENRNPVRG